MALVQSMDIETLQKPTMIAPADEVPKQRVHVPKQQIVEKQQQHDIFHGGPRFEDLSIQRVDTPCPPALRRQQQPAVGSSYVLLPDCAEIGSSRRFIALEAGQTTVVSSEIEIDEGVDCCQASGGRVRAACSCEPGKRSQAAVVGCARRTRVLTFLVVFFAQRPPGRCNTRAPVSFQPSRQDFPHRHATPLSAPWYFVNV